MVLCMVSSVWAIESYLKRPRLYPNVNKLWWRMSIGLLMKTPCLGLPTIATPMAKSTPVTQASQVSVIPIVPLPERDMVEPVSSERARTAYVE